jgi:hypothetical protein
VHGQRVGEAEYHAAVAGLGQLRGRRRGQRAGHDRDAEPERREHQQVRGLGQLERRRHLQAGPAHGRVDVPADPGSRGELDEPPPAEEVRDRDGTDEPACQLL